MTAPMTGPVTSPVTEIVSIDPDGPRYDEWYDVYRLSDVYGREGRALPMARQEVRVLLREPMPKSEKRAYAVVSDGGVVAGGWLHLHRVDNTNRAEVEVWTHPAHGRRGHGSRMLAHLEDVAASEGRTVLGAEVPWELGSEDPVGCRASFMRGHGYELVLADVQRRLALPVAEERLAALTPGLDGYALRTWTGPVPDGLVAEWADLVASLDTEAPMGDLDYEEVTPDIEEIRAGERISAEQGRVSVAAVALRPDGRLAAYSEIYVGAEDPIAYQWGTLVRREDRGHRLGLAVKVANLRVLQARFPHVASVSTYNAASNVHMIAVNEALGFVPTERLGEFQKRLRSPERA
jgi:GNAT superfamily N-acetyltransferase